MSTGQALIDSLLFGEFWVILRKQKRKVPLASAAYPVSHPAETPTNLAYERV